MVTLCLDMRLGYTSISNVTTQICKWTVSFWRCMWDYSPHQLSCVWPYLGVNFGRKIKIDSVLETGESRAYHAYSIAVYQWPITLVSVGLIEYNPKCDLYFLLVLCSCKKSASFYYSRQKNCTKSYAELKGYVEGTVLYVYVPVRIEISPFLLIRLQRWH
jgi:hypothetical protein